MSIMTRLKKLEQQRPNLVADPAARAKLLEFMRANYERIAETEMSKGWLAEQSNLTAIAIAMFRDLPLPDYVTARLEQISDNGGSPAKLAAIVLRTRV